LFDHAPYSPDLAPSDYQLRTYVKNCWNQSASTKMRSWWKVSKCGWTHRWQLLWHKHTQTYSQIQVPLFRRWLRCEVALVCM
jgi:hypothetical protein